MQVAARGAVRCWSRNGIPLGGMSASTALLGAGDIAVRAARLTGRPKKGRRRPTGSSVARRALIVTPPVRRRLGTVGQSDRMQTRRITHPSKCQPGLTRSRRRPRHHVQLSFAILKWRMALPTPTNTAPSDFSVPNPGTRRLKSTRMPNSVGEQSRCPATRPVTQAEK